MAHEIVTVCALEYEPAAGENVGVATCGELDPTLNMYPPLPRIFPPTKATVVTVYACVLKNKIDGANAALDPVP